MIKKIIFHIDVNSAFLSWEASYRVNILGEKTDLRDIPSVVGGDQESRHGIVLAKSIPAKQFHISTGEPLVSAQEKCPGLTIVSPHYEMYVEASKALMTLLREYSPHVEQYSIDESFCDMTGTAGLFGSPVASAEMIKDRISRELGFTVNIGISTNKLLAKMASDFQKPNRVHTLFPEEIPSKMWPLPVGELFFVGHATEEKLHKYGILTIGQLAHTDPMLLRSNFKSYGRLLWEFANGDGSQMDKLTMSPINKGYGNSITIPFDVTDPATAKKVLLSLTETVCSRMRTDHAYISVIAVSIVNCNFQRTSKQVSLSSSTDVTRQIYEIACSLFDTLWDHTPIRQLGVHTSKATQSSMYQYSLFDTCNIDKEIALNRAIDQIRSEYGEDAIMRGTFLKRGPLSHMSGGVDSSRRSGITKAL